MPQRVDSPFSNYTLSEEELRVARSLGTEQRAYYQALMADAATEKIALVYDPYKPLLFVQTEAYLRGQIDILNMLLSDESVSRPKKAIVITRPETDAIPDVVLPTSREPKTPVKGE